jgi:uncharacterized protein (TIGR03382 family)
MGDGCLGYVSGAVSDFYLIEDPMSCPAGNCLRATWPSNGSHLRVHTPPFTPEPDTLHAQARFRFSGGLLDRLTSADASTQIPLLRLVTSDPDTWAQVILAGSPPRLEVSALRAGEPVGDFTPSDVVVDPDRWMTIELGVDGRSGEGLLYFYLDGARQEDVLVLPDGSATFFTDAYALGTVVYGGSPAASPPTVEIDELCIAEDRAAARAGCPVGTMVPRDAGVDGSVDARVPRDAAPDDARPVRDGSGAVDPGVSFRGAGGLACGAASAPAMDGAFLVLVFVLLRRRRRL